MFNTYLHAIETIDQKPWNNIPSFMIDEAERSAEDFQPLPRFYVKKVEPDDSDELVSSQTLDFFTMMFSHFSSLILYFL